MWCFKVRLRHVSVQIFFLEVNYQNMSKFAHPCSGEIFNSLSTWAGEIKPELNFRYPFFSHTKTSLFTPLGFVYKGSHKTMCHEVTQHTSCCYFPLSQCVSLIHPCCAQRWRWVPRSAAEAKQFVPWSPAD